MEIGFAETEITPDIGTAKIGWLKLIVPDRIRDPLYARAMVIRNEESNDVIGLIQLDTLCVRWSTAMRIRRGIEQRCGVAGSSVMVSATHNHGGPAVAILGDVPRDEVYLNTLASRCVDLFADAWNGRRAGEIGFASVPQFGIGFNRRVIMRNGTVNTHGNFRNANALCLEGPVDPEVAVIACRGFDGTPMVVLVNFTCHPTDFGAGDCFSAGWPGGLADELKKRGWPCPMFLNGAAGDISTTDPYNDRGEKKIEEISTCLADDVDRAVIGMTYERQISIGSRQVTLQLPYRRPSHDQIQGTAIGAQRFIDSAIYERDMPRVTKRIRTRKRQPMELQALFMHNHALVSVPAELFCSLGLRIKECTYPRHTLVIGYANGMIGYVPHREAFGHGGYETTFASSSRMAPDTGDLIAAAAIDLVKAGPK